MVEDGMDHLSFLAGGEESATMTNVLLRLLAENSLAQLVVFADAVRPGVA
jgi:hypothetical protein